MDDSIKTKRVKGKESKLTQNNERQIIVDSPDCPCPERTWHITEGL